MDELIDAVVAHLRTKLSLGAEFIDNQEDGKPPPVCGQEYYAISQGEWSNDAANYLDERLGVDVTITLRTPFAPVDRSNDAVGKVLRRKANAVKAALHMDYGVLALADTALTSANQGFIHPLVFLGCDRPTVRGADWFWAENDDGRSVDPSGLSITLKFGRAQRVQRIEEQED